MDFEAMIRDAQKNGLTSQRCSLRLLTRSSRRIIKLNAETTATMVGKEPDELLQVLLDKVDNLFDAVPKSKDKSDNEKIADFLREIGL